MTLEHIKESPNPAFLKEVAAQARPEGEEFKCRVLCPQKKACAMGKPAEVKCVCVGGGGDGREVLARKQGPD